MTGAAGLLGSWLLSTASRRSEVAALTYRRAVEGSFSVQADLRDAAAIEDAVRTISPRLVIHTAYAKDRPSIVDATANLIDAVSSSSIPLIFVSSDAVFNGDGVGRDEASQPDPISEYGRWKRDAEQLVHDRVEHGSVVRLPLLVSIDPDDHVVKQIRSGSTAGTGTRWFVNQMRQPVRAVDAAEAIWRIAGLPAFERSGVWHLAGAEHLSRYDIACRMVERLGLPVSAIGPAFASDTDDQPLDIVMSDARSRIEIGWSPAEIP